MDDYDYSSDIQTTILDKYKIYNDKYISYTKKINNEVFDKIYKDFIDAQNTTTNKIVTPAPDYEGLLEDTFKKLKAICAERVDRIVRLRKIMATIEDDDSRNLVEEILNDVTEDCMELLTALKEIEPKIR